MNVDSEYAPVTSDWRSSAWATTVKTAIDKSSATPSSNISNSNSELLVHTLSPAQSFCSWSGAHNSLDIVGLHNCTRNRNVFRVATFKLDHNDPLKSSMEAVTQIKTEGVGSIAAMADNTICIANEDGTINVYPLRDTSSRKFIEEPKKLATLSGPESPITSTQSSIMGTTLSKSGLEKHQFPLPKQAIAMDLTYNSNSGGSTSSGSANDTKLLAQIGGKILTWDLGRLGSHDKTSMTSFVDVIPTKVASYRALRWMPLSTGHSLFSRGSMHGTIKIYDLRSNDPKKQVFQIKKAHIGSIRDISWNPFVPYWFATAGSDSTIQIWDTRYGSSPVRQLTDHCNAVNVVSWCPTNADILSSGGADRSFKLWNLRVDPHFVVASVARWDSAIVGVGWSHNRPNTPAYAVSATGVVQSCVMNSNFLLPMTPQLDQQQKEAIRKVERAIFARDFSLGFQKAYQLAQQYLAENKIAQANSVLNICYQRQGLTDLPFEEKKFPKSSFLPSAAPTNSSNSSSNTSSSQKKSITAEQFEKDLLFYSYYIPPNYPDHLWPVVDSKLMFSIEALKMSIDLEQYIRDEDAAGLVKIVPDVADFMKRDPNAVDIQIIFRLFCGLLPYDFLSSLELGYQIAKVFTKSPTHFYPIANMLLFPTLYDTNTNREAVYADVLSPTKQRSDSRALDGSRSSSVSSAAAPPLQGSNITPGGASSSSVTFNHKLYAGIQNAASALNIEITSSFLADQLEFNYNFFKALWGNNPKSAMDIFDSNNNTCLSSTTWRIYLNMLLLHRQHDKLFIKGSKLGEKVKGFPFADSLNQVLGDAVPILQKYLRDCASLGMGLASGSSSSRASRDSEFPGPAHSGDSGTSSESLQSVHRLGMAGNMVLNILHNSDPRYLPKTLTGTLPTSLHQLCVDLETSIHEVIDEDSSMEEAQQHARITVALKHLSSGMKEVLGKKEPSGQFMEAIVEYKTMIENATRNYATSTVAPAGGSTGTAGLPGAAKKITKSKPSSGSVSPGLTPSSSNTAITSSGGASNPPPGEMTRSNRNSVSEIPKSTRRDSVTSDTKKL